MSIIEDILTLDSKAEIKSLNDKQLAALLKTLEDKAKAEVEVEAEAKKGHFIAPGKSLTSKRGVLGPGDPVTEDSFYDGRKTLASWVKKGYVVHVK